MSGGIHMKKMLILLILSLSVLFIQFSTSASGGQEPAGLNYLSLSNLKVHPYQYTAETIDHIRLVKGQRYTLVIDFDTLGRHLANLGDLWIEVEFFPGPYSGDYYFDSDMSNQRIYLEFIAEDIDFRISYLPIDDESSTYHMILYRGTYLEFPGFEPYLHPSDQLTTEGLLPMDYDHRLSIEDIENLIIAQDPMGNTLPKTIVSDTFSSSDQRPGDYQVVFSTVYNQIRKRYILDIRVLDITAPIIQTEGVMDIPLNQKKTVTEIINSLTVTDNVDIIHNSELIIIEDTYTSAHQVGNYHLKLRATDQSGNQSEAIIDIALVDRLGPSILGPSSIYVYTTDTPLSNEVIKSKFTAIDDVDGPGVTVSITLNHYTQKTQPGIYTVEISASDSQGNTTTFLMNVHVVDNRSSHFIIDTQVLSKTTAESMSETEIIDWFKNQMLSIGMSVSHVRILYNEYEELKNQEGQYYVYLSYEQGGSESITRIMMDVTEAHESDIPFYIWIPISILTVLFSSVLYIKLKKK
jgi:hypothetical protein